MLRQLQLLACAVQFLTRVPVPLRGDFEPGLVTRAARYFPLVGQMVGLVSAGAWLGASQLWPPALAAVFAVAVSAVITGALHEDGLADAADGLGGGATPERRLEIMKDSRIGTYGVLALGLVTAVRIGALATLAPMLGAFVLVAGHGAARAACLMVMRATPYAGNLQAARWTPSADPPSFGEFVTAALIAIWPFVLLPQPVLFAGLAPALLAAWLTMLAARHAIGGHTGDILGAVEQVFEVVFLAATAAVAARG